MTKTFSKLSVGHALSLTLCLLLSACAGTPAGTQPAERCPEPSRDNQDYVLGAGDQVQIFVWRNEELSSTVPVRPDGKISIPLVEDMQAAGKTTSQLARDIEEVLAEFLRSPTVNVIIGQQGPSNQVQVVGEVTTPQSIPYREGLRVLDVLVGVGGLAEFAAGNRARISRTVDGRQIECSVKADRLLGGDMSQNIPVFPGDVLIVPESRF